MVRIVGLSGSLRTASYNSALLRAAVELKPSDAEIRIESIRDIPLYNGDDEVTHGVPPAVAALKNTIADADALLLVTPEYNNSIPGVFKNAIDWLSRPPADIERVFGNKPVGLIGATPGPGATRLSQTAWLQVLRSLGTRPFFQKGIYVAGAAKVFDTSGRLTDPELRTRLQSYLAAFAAFAAAR